MAHNYSQTELKKIAGRFDGLKARIANVRARAEKTTEKLLRTAETGGAAFAAGVIQGRTGGVEIVGVPLELGLGAALNVFGYFGGAGKYSDHLNNLGDGFLAAYLTTLGRGVGATMLTKTTGGETKQVTQTDQAQIKAKGTRLTADEIAQAAEAAAVNR